MDSSIIDEKDLSSVLVFVHGGAWGSGEKYHYWRLGNNFRKKKIVTVIINYSIYPKGYIEDMVEDLSKALIWTKNNIQLYGGNPNSIYCLGHSAGSHIIAMFLIKQCIFRNFGENSSFLHSYSHINWKGSISIQGYIGLSGVYDINEHYLWETNRAVEQISTMKPAMRGFEVNLS